MTTTRARAASEATRVLVVDDHRMFAELLRSTLEQHDDLVITGVAVDGDEAVDRAAADAPDVVVLDYRLPGDDGVTVAARIRRAAPDARLIMLTGHDDDQVMRAAVAVGCTGFVTKDRAADELIHAVRAVRDGGTAFDTDRLARLVETRTGPTRRDSLTQRERDVLELLVEGATTRQIAERLFISHNTARNHVQHLIRKLGAHSRVEAIATALRKGLTAQPRQ